MDRARYEELMAKRDDVGLSDEEANELGRLIAELEGGAYASADTVREAEAEAEAVPTGGGEDPCGHLGCRCLAHEGYCSAFCRAHATQPSDAGPAYDCGCEHDACKAVVGEA